MNTTLRVIVFGAIVCSIYANISYARDSTNQSNYSSLTDKELESKYLKASQRAYLLIFKLKVSRYCHRYNHYDNDSTVSVKIHFRNLVKYLTDENLSLSKSQTAERIDALDDMYNCYFKLQRSEARIRQPFSQISKDLKEEIRINKKNTFEPRQTISKLKQKIKDKEEALAQQRKRLNRLAKYKMAVVDHQKALSSVFFEQKNRTTNRIKKPFRNQNRLWVDPRPTEDQLIRQMLKKTLQ